MNAVPRSAIPAQQHRSRKLTANSRITPTRAAHSSTVTSIPSGMTGPKVETLNTGNRRLATVTNSVRPINRYAPAGLRGSNSVDKASSHGVAPQTLTLSQQLTPKWLSWLLLLRRSSDLITFLLVTTTLTIYSWTVYTQQQWTQEYRELEKLQRAERQLTTANAVMKDQLAQQAERPATGLVAPTPQTNAIFLPPAPQRKSSTPPTQTTDPEPAANSPLGY